MAWATIGISFFFRPLGAVVAGHLGDRIGRKAMLVFTLVMFSSFGDDTLFLAPGGEGSTGLRLRRRR